MLSSVQIFAAGVENTETMELQIGDSVVQSWSNVGGDAYAGQFVTYQYDTPETISANDVRINFTDDAFDPVAGIDKNLRVDAIVIDGVRFETESPVVFSTGTWTPTDGIVPGNRESEYLHTNGYFQYADNSSGQQTQVIVNARGTTGEESFALQIDGSTVQTFNNINTGFSSYRFTANGSVSADQVRVVFLNDFYDPANASTATWLLMTSSWEVFNTKQKRMMYSQQALGHRLTESSMVLVAVTLCTPTAISSTAPLRLMVATFLWRVAN